MNCLVMPDVSEMKLPNVAVKRVLNVNYSGVAFAPESGR